MSVLTTGGSPTALWYASRGTGLLALILLTTSVVLGLLVSVRFAGPTWPRLLTAGLHRNVSLLVVAFLTVHVLTAVLDSFAPIGWLDVLVPFVSAYRPLWLGLGTVALDLLLAVTLTSLMRVRLGYRAWRAVHWAAYVCWPVALGHGLATGTDTRLRWVLAVDAACVAMVLAALWWRLATGVAAARRAADRLGRSEPAHARGACRVAAGRSTRPPLGRPGRHPAGTAVGEREHGGGNTSARVRADVSSPRFLAWWAAVTAVQRGTGRRTAAEPAQQRGAGRGRDLHPAHGRPSWCSRRRHRRRPRQPGRSHHDRQPGQLRPGGCPSALPGPGHRAGRRPAASPRVRCPTRAADLGRHAAPRGHPGDRSAPGEHGGRDPAVTDAGLDRAGPDRAGPDRAGPRRLLAGWQDTGRPAGLAEHLHRYGSPPLHGGRRGNPDLIDMVAAAGLVGRGGAWFPTAIKMRAVAAGRGRAVVVVNGGESEPASRKDKVLVSVAPHLVLDGAMLAADAVGADEVIVAVPAVPGLVDRVQAAVRDRVAARLDPFPVRVVSCPDRYVASEETALIRHLNGGPALPTFTPPRPFQRGVRGRPTLVQNVETLAHLALIARQGAEWFRAVGTAEAPGSALVTVSGAVATPGVYEVEVGARLSEVLDLAGGVTEPVQAVLVGGYFGAWLPASALDTAVTPAPLLAAGGLLGAGVVLALPAAACGLAESARILSWLAAQNAGQCGPCVNGLPAIAADLSAVAVGVSTPAVVRRLNSRLAILPGRGACHHPDGAVRLAASALRTFATDMVSHIRSGPCAANRRPPLAPLPTTGTRVGRPA